MEEKSRKFGKFNIVDIIVLVIIVLGLIFVATKFLGNDDTQTAAGGVKIEYTVLVREVDPLVCDTVMGYKKANVQLMANGAMVDGYVTDIDYRPHVNYETNSDGIVVVSQEEGENARMDMIFTIQATANNAVNYKVGTQEVRIGKTHIVKTTEFEMEGYDAVTLTREVIQ